MPVRLRQGTPTTPLSPRCQLSSPSFLRTSHSQPRQGLPVLQATGQTNRHPVIRRSRSLSPLSALARCKKLGTGVGHTVAVSKRDLGK